MLSKYKNLTLSLYSFGIFEMEMNKGMSEAIV